MKKVTISIITVIAISLLFFGVAAAAEDKTKSKMDQSSTSGMMSDSQSQFVRASNIMDKSVKNDQDQDLGQINELLFSKDGDLKYIVFSKGSTLGVGGDLIPVPYEAVKDSIRFQEDNVIISGWSEDRLDNAPTVSEDELAGLSQGSGQTFDRVHAYFGEGAAGSKSSTTQTPGSQYPSSSQPRSYDTQKDSSSQPKSYDTQKDSSGSMGGSPGKQ